MTSPYFTIINPYTQEAIKNVPWSTELEIHNALKLVKNQDRSRSIQERVTVLEKLSNLLDQQQLVFAKHIATETGKPISDGILEIQRATVTIKNVSQELASLKGEVYYSDSAYYQAHAKPDFKYCLSKRVPYGVVLAIAPFNFPINLAIHKIAPAFAMGNTILLKPHPQCFDTSSMLIKLCHEAGMQKSDIQMIYPSNELLTKLITTDDIDLVSFTGGTATAKILVKSCGLKKTVFELGGNDGLVVLPDADLEKVSQTIIVQRFRCAGQRCTAPKKIFVHQSIKKQLIDNLLKKVQLLKMGDPLSEITDIGPVISNQSKIFITQKIEESMKQGASAITSYIAEGNIIAPVILDGVTPNMPIVAEEIFGPVASLIQFSDNDKVIKDINSSRLGLQCGVFTSDIHVLKKFFNELNVGSVLANEGPAYRMEQFPFGGNKDSGHGREGSHCALKEFSTIRNFIF